MPKRARIDFDDLVDATASFDARIAKADLKLLTVAESTVKQYRSAANTVSKFAARLGEKKVTKDIFIRFAAGLQKTGRGGVDTLKQTLSAIRFLQNAEGLWGEPWAEDSDLDDVVAGVCYNGKKSRRSTTGAITYQMLQMLIKRCVALKKHSLVPAFKIAYAANLRVRQTATLKTDALVPSENDQWLIRVDKDKRVREKSKK